MHYNKPLMEPNSYTPEPEHLYNPEVTEAVSAYRNSIYGIRADTSLSEVQKEALMTEAAMQFHDKTSHYSEGQLAFAMWSLSSEDEWTDFSS